MSKTYEQQRSRAQRIEDESIRERVLRGLEVVRARYGDDWADHIEPADLDLQSGSCCVLGQLQMHINGVYGEPYWHALREIDGDVEENPSAFGFDAVVGQTAEYEALTDAWLLVIEDD